MPATNLRYHIARMARSYSIRARVGAGHARDPGAPLPATGPQMFQPSGPAIEPPSASTALPVM